MKRILVIDDSLEMLYAVELILTHNNFIVKTSSRWSKVQDSIDTFIPDLILMDIELNGGDGGEICKDLKQRKDNQKIPIILFSAFNMPQTYIDDSNAQGFVCKPFEIPHLLETIRNNLS